MLVGKGNLDYRDLDYRNPRNPGIYKKNPSNRDFLLINPLSLNTAIPIIEELDFFPDYRKLFLDLVIPIIKDLLYVQQDLV